MYFALQSVEAKCYICGLYYFIIPVQFVNVYGTVAEQFVWDLVTLVGKMNMVRWMFVDCFSNMTKLGGKTSDWFV